MARQRDPNKKVPVTVRLTPEMRERVRDAAEQEDATVTDVVTEALDKLFNEQSMAAA